jgi:23S rRNA G2069 N7-methylase RlmK/C1962 C5-methylase RlmI
MLKETIACRCSFECSKIETFLEKYAHSNTGPWDVVILDPPKLAPSQRHLKGALRKYAALNGASMRALAPGGLLMTCSCSGAIAQDSQDLLLKVVTQAARPLRRPVTLLRRAGAAADHVIDPFHPHGTYLTNLLVRVSGP